MRAATKRGDCSEWGPGHWALTFTGFALPVKNRQ